MVKGAGGGRQMEIIDELREKSVWQEFLEYKKEKSILSKKELEELECFISNEKYLPVVDNIIRTKDIAIPYVLEINKNGTDKKRTVFTFDYEENYVLKVITYRLKKYDGLFSDNLFSFRSDTGVRNAVNKVIKRNNFKRLYTYKVDIHDYFNSVDTNWILKQLQEALPQETKLITLFNNMLRNPYAINALGEKVMVKKGIMAGVPTAGFMANLYLRDMDKWFWDNKVAYARYSDDIIVLSYEPKDIERYEFIIKKILKEKGLTVNEKKEKRTFPGDRVEFLGFSFSSDGIDTADITIQKLKGKLKRKARALYRWKLKKNATGKMAVRAYIKFLNKKFYHNSIRGEITWCRWYFPIITTDESLKIIDDYAISCMRYIVTGNYGKKNYNLRYEEIQQLGFNSLVNNFWKFKHGKYEINNE